MKNSFSINIVVLTCKIVFQLSLFIGASVSVQLQTLFRQLLHRWTVDCATFCVTDKTASNLLFCSKGYTEQITGDKKKRG